MNLKLWLPVIAASLWSDIYILGDLRAETNGGMAVNVGKNGGGGTNSSTSSSDNANSNSEQ